MLTDDPRYTMITVRTSDIVISRILLKDCQDISIDGNTNAAFTENVEQRFVAYGWQVLRVRDGDKYAMSPLLIACLS